MVQRRTRLRQAAWGLGLVLAPTLLAADTRFALDAAEWARPRSAEAVTAMPAVRDAVRAWAQTPSAELVVRHPSGESGLLWGEELRSWLVALGVPGDATVLAVGGGLDGEVELMIRRTTNGGRQ